MHAAEKHHHVRHVADDALPPDQDFALIEVDDELYLVVKQERLTPGVLEDAWTAYLALGQARVQRAGGHPEMPGCCPLVGHAC